MRNSIAMASFMALAAGTVGAGALDSVPHMVGSDTLKDLTLSVLSHCTALQGSPAPIGYDGTGSGNGEAAMKTVTGGKQLVAPMSKPLSSGICAVSPGEPTVTQRAGAEGMIVALDGVAIDVNTNNVGAEGIDYPGNAADPSNQWRTVLRLVYTGMDISAGTNVFARDCNSAARQNIVNNWDNVFHGTVTSCTDSHPSVPGAGANGYDQNNAIIEPGIRHAFRRDDASGTTDVFLAQLGMSGVNFAQGAPNLGTATPAGTLANVYRAAAGSPFCNNKRPEDRWDPVTLPVNTVQGFHVSQIPEVAQVGTPVGALPGGEGFSLIEGTGPQKPSYVQPYFNEYTDQDPIRRKCVGRGSNANAQLPMEQVCSADGKLGVVLPISIPPLPVASLYPTVACDPSLGFALGQGFTRPNGDAVRCPNGDVEQNFQCLLPVRSDGAGGVRFDCINPPGNVPLAINDTDGDGSQFGDAPGTDGRTDVDGRVYNLAARAADGTLLTETRNNPNAGTTSTPLAPIATAVAGAFWRIHTTRSLLLPPAHTTSVCQTFTDDTSQIGCLTTASPCSIGYAGRESVTNNTGVSSALVNGIANTDANIKALVQTGDVYPLARKLYLNSVQGFDILPDSSTSAVPNSVPNFDAEEELAKCYGSLLYNGTIDVSSFGFVHLPLTTGSSVEKPLCEDFNGNTTCSPADATNTDACVGNDTIVNSNGLIPTSSCVNGLKDGDETAADVCPAARPTCDVAGTNGLHHCH